MPQPNRGILAVFLITFRPFLFVERIYCSPPQRNSVEVSVFKYQPGVQTPVEQLHNYRINSRGGAITGSLNQTEERRGENVSGSVDIAAGVLISSFDPHGPFPVHGVS